MATKIIPESIRDFLRYDPKTGEFRWKVENSRRAKAGSIAGHIAADSGYIYIRLNGTLYRAHRLAWFFVHGEQPNVIDHINHDRADNRIANLRNVDKSTNNFNRKGFYGVCWVKPRNGKKGYWRAGIRRKSLYFGKNITLAYFHRIMAERADHPIGIEHLK